MLTNFKNILYIYLDKKEYEFKSHEDLWPYIGGVAMAYKILLDNIDLKPIILACGPLSGKFPYVSKSVLLYTNGTKVVEAYGGGTIHANLGFSKIDAVVFIGNTDENLKINISGREVIFSVYERNVVESKNTDFYLANDTALSENYFSFGVEKLPEVNLSGKISLTVDSTESEDLRQFYDYEKLYDFLIAEFKKLTVEPRNNPSCYGCPIGCELSAKGENDLNIGVLPRSLVACGYAESIFKHIPLVYACLNAVGYKYQHADLEMLPSIVGKVKAKVKEYLEKNDKI
jgi:aldehyde:ferredoxin oxidoreductase